MFRSAIVASLAILLAPAPALFPNIAQASTTLAVPAFYDFAGAAFQTLFGETTDADATLAAAYGDRASESPLRDLAIVPFAYRARNVAYLPALSTPPTFAAERSSRPASLASAGQAPSGDRVFQPNGARFVPAAVYASVPSLAVDPPRQVTPVESAPSIAPSTVAANATQVSVPGPVIALGSSAFSNKQNALANGFAPASSSLPVSARLGHLQFDGRIASAETQTSVPADQDSAYETGAAFAVRAGAHRVNVDVSSSYEHLMRDDTISYSSAIPPSSQWDIGGVSTPALPSYADMSKLALGAKLAVPVSTTMTLGLNYNAQRLLGEYGLPGLGNLDAIDSSYGGNVTLAIPKWSSQLSVSAGQYHYQDNIAPANTFSNLRGNLNLTVKF
jgi:hypothetical protein